MIVGIGTDIIEIQKIQQAIEKNPRFLERVFTSEELEYAIRGEKVSYESLAGMWAAKEAYAKATGQGFRNFALRDVEVMHNKISAPYLRLHRAADCQDENNIWLSISHSDSMATAFCIIERKNDEQL